MRAIATYILCNAIVEATVRYICIKSFQYFETLHRILEIIHDHPKQIGFGFFIHR